MERKDLEEVSNAFRWKCFQHSKVWMQGILWAWQKSVDNTSKGWIGKKLIGNSHFLWKSIVFQLVAFVIVEYIKKRIVCKLGAYQNISSLSRVCVHGWKCLNGKFEYLRNKFLVRNFCKKKMIENKCNYLN